jgi:hypothetical protein
VAKLDIHVLGHKYRIEYDIIVTVCLARQSLNISQTRHIRY